MREILFRGKRIDNGEWVEGYLAAYDMICPSHTYPVDTVSATGLFYGLTPYVGFVDIDPATIGEYTGLTDKNGERIFEGDILEHHAQGDIIVNRGEVGWDERHGMWVHKLNTMTPSFYMHNHAAVEVIGNIHDNPELLEVHHE